MIIDKINREKVIEDKKDFDILNMLNSISNFEVFTPYEVAVNMVNLIPTEVFKDPSSRFLDPAVKSGIFLREIVYKLVEHLPNTKHTDSITGKTYDLSDPKQRVSHILRNMVYGIAISELTSYVTRRTLYGVMEANADKATEYLDSKINAGVLKIDRSEEDHLDFNNFFDHTMFNTPDRVGYEREGNIFYPNDETTIANEDTHHPFINDTDHKFINLIKEGKMKFDVIIGNPPYQASDGGHGSSAKPIYNIFIEKSIELEPRYLSMIVPSRWMNGGKGLNDFRKKMKEDKRLKIIIDDPDSSKFFNGVNISGGINYFLWDRNHNGLCNFNGINRDINEFENIIRDNESISILNKINKINKNPSLLSGISTRKPFGIETNFTEYKEEKSDLNSIKIYGNRNLMKETNGIGYVSLNQIEKGFEFIDKHKVIIPYAGGNSPVGIILPKPFYSEPNSICSETYIILKICENKEECENFIKYIKTKFFRFLVSLIKDTQHATKRVYNFVPDLSTNEVWSDDKLYKLFNLSESEIEHIEKSILPME